MNISHSLKMASVAFMLTLGIGQAVQAQASKDEQSENVVPSREDDVRKYGSRNTENLKAR